MLASFGDIYTFPPSSYDTVLASKGGIKYKGKLDTKSLEDFLNSRLIALLSAIEEEINSMTCLVTKLEDREGKFTITFENIPAEIKKMHIYSDDIRTIISEAKKELA